MHRITPSEPLNFRNGRFANNLVMFHDDELTSAVSVGASTSPDSFEFAENLFRRG